MAPAAPAARLVAPPRSLGLWFQRLQACECSGSSCRRKLGRFMIPRSIQASGCFLCGHFTLTTRKSYCGPPASLYSPVLGPTGPVPVFSSPPPPPEKAPAPWSTAEDPHLGRKPTGGIRVAVCTLTAVGEPRLPQLSGDRVGVLIQPGWGKEEVTCEQGHGGEIKSKNRHCWCFLIFGFGDIPSRAQGWLMSRS